MSSPAGWYQDPNKPRGHLRYWDGAQWTEHHAVPPSAVKPISVAGGKATAWVRGHKVIAALIAVVVLGWTVNVAAGHEQGAGRDSASDAAASDSPAVESDAPAKSGKKESKRTSKGNGRDKRATPEPSPKPSKEPTRNPSPRTYLVTRVIDGDTIELGNGADVRVVGIDTPEVGQCGYEAATNNMARMVLNKQVRLTISDEDTDQYGRWLRYVNVEVLDAGLQQIKQGFAIARYDSRDGYGYHVREPRYIAADRASKNRSCPKPAPAPPPANNGGVGGACAPGYSPCVPPFPPDVDCADVNGPISVTGTDPHGLDADGDGVACE